VTERDFKNWLSAMQKNLSEEGSADKDPGEASDWFNKNDTLNVNTPGSPTNSDTFPLMPELIGKDPDTISQYGAAKERVQARAKTMKESEQSIKFPSLK